MKRSQALTGLLLSGTLILSGCGVFTGIPSHGGGKRFSVEQRLVSSSARAALKQFDLSSLRGKKVYFVYSFIADTGGGTLTGGRMDLAGLLGAGALISPVQNTSNKYQVFDLTNVGTSYSNAGTTGSTTRTSVATTNSNNKSEFTNTTTPGTTVTTQTGDVKTTQTPSGTDTTTGTSEGEGTSKTDASDTGKTTSETKATGGSTSNVQVVEGPVSSRQQTRGSSKNVSVQLQYRGLGDYTVLEVPASDVSLFIGLTQNYFMLNGINVTVPFDPTADAIVYVAVDIFGINRSRFDALVVNQERVTAETGLEMFAFDRSGSLIMGPRSSNYEAQYSELYLFWAGPLQTKQRVRPGKGLTVDFSDVDENYTGTVTRTDASICPNVGRKCID